MRYVFDHDYHIHSFLSDCSNDPAENTKRILEYAGQNDFVVIPTTHLHMNDLTIAPEDRNVEGRAKCWVSRLEKVLNMQLPFHKIGIELNSFDVRCTEKEAETILRPLQIAKQCGCKFYMGSDAHHPADLDEAKSMFERAIDWLELTEDDKFVLTLN